MNIGIIGGNLEDLKQVDAQIMKLCEEKQFFLFNTLVSSDNSLGAKWAEMRGSPKIYCDIKWFWKKVDYIFFIYKGEQNIKNAIMKAQNIGIHGTVIKCAEAC